MTSFRLWNRVHYRREGLQVSTRGLLDRGRPELVAPVSSPELLPDAEHFLRYVVRYLDEARTRISGGQTLSYGYWLVKFQPVIESAESAESAPESALEVWEYNAAGTEFVRGASLALRYWREQQTTCEKHRAVFDPPNPERLTVVSEGVMEGDVLEGVRYPSPGHMSGWWLLAPKYNGDVKALRTIHTYHLTSKRPDLARFLALPNGFRFDSGGGTVWFDPAVAGQPPI